MLTEATTALAALLAGSTLTWIGEPAGGDARSVASYCADGTVHTRFEGTSPEGVHHLGVSDGRWRIVAADGPRSGVVRFTRTDGSAPRRQAIRVMPRRDAAVLGDRRYRWARGAADC